MASWWVDIKFTCVLFLEYSEDKLKSKEIVDIFELVLGLENQLAEDCHFGHKST